LGPVISEQVHWGGKTVGEGGLETIQRMAFIVSKGHWKAKC